LDGKIFVLDEADRMLDMGFNHDVKRILVRFRKKDNSLFFSRKHTARNIKLANTILAQSSKVSVTLIPLTVDIIKQSFTLLIGNKTHCG